MQARFNLHKHLVLAVLTFQVFIPQGLMPGAGGDGWYLQICPDGLPGEFVEQLRARSNRTALDPATHHPGDHNGHHTTTADHTDHARALDCFFASLAADLDRPEGFESALPTAVLVTPTPAGLIAYRRVSAYLPPSRGPPRYSLNR
ncbi:MAG: hypothetical protein AAF513_01565 [Pseudomonadota bacterium]